MLKIFVFNYGMVNILINNLDVVKGGIFIKFISENNDGRNC